MKQYNTVLRIFGFLLLLGLAIVVYDAFLSQNATSSLAQVSEENSFLGILSFFVLMVVTTVVAPLSSLPLVPLLAPIFGPFMTGFIAYCGWLCGAAVIFYIARSCGQPFIRKYVQVQPTHTLRKYIRGDVQFVTLTLLHMVIPNDVLSYGIAMSTRISFSMYMSTTALGVIWVPFFLAYGGEAFFKKDYVLIIIIGVVSGLIVLGARGILQKMKP